MTQVTLPLDLYNDLVENLIECLNTAINEGDDYMEGIHRTELDRCNEIQKELSNDS